MILVIFLLLWSECVLSLICGGTGSTCTYQVVNCASNLAGCVQYGGNWYFPNIDVMGNACKAALGSSGERWIGLGFDVFFLKTTKTKKPVLSRLAIQTLTIWYIFNVVDLFSVFIVGFAACQFMFGHDDRFAPLYEQLQHVCRL